jgi:uncharacterized protein with HEPN domain
LPSDKRIRHFEDIRDNIARIERFTAGLDFQAFSANEQVTFAVFHALLIVSEAARRLGTDAETLAPSQPWRAIRSLGNVLRHEYEVVDTNVIWRIITADLPALKAASEHVLADLRSGTGS